MPNRFFKLRPVDYSGIEVYQPNFELMNQVLAGRQENYNNLLASSEKFRDLMPKGGYGTTDAAASLSNDFNQEMDSIVDEITTTGTGNIRRIINLARNLKKDPRYSAAQADEAYKPTAMQTILNEKFPDAIQNFYDPETGYKQVKYDPSKGIDEATDFDPASFYRTHFPTDWASSYAKTTLDLINEKITDIEPNIVGKIREVTVTDLEGNPTGVKLMAEYASGEHREFTRKMVEGLLNNTGLGDVIADTHFPGEDFRSAQHEKLYNSPYSRNKKFTDILNSLEGKYHSTDDLKYTEKLVSQSAAPKGQTKDPSVIPHLHIIGQTTAGVELGQVDGEIKERVNTVLIKPDGSRIDPTTSKGKQDTYYNSQQKLETFETGTESGLMDYLKEQGLLGDDDLGITFKKMAEEYTMSNYFVKANEAGYVPLPITFVADHPEIRAELLRNIKYADGTEIPEGEKDAYLNQVLQKASLPTGEYNESLRTVRRVEQGLKESDANTASDMIVDIDKELERLSGDVVIRKVMAIANPWTLLLPDSGIKFSFQEKQAAELLIKKQLIEEYGASGEEIFKLEQSKLNTRGLTGDPGGKTHKAEEQRLALLDKKINNIKEKGFNSEYLKKEKDSMISNLDAKYFPPKREPATYLDMTFLPKDWTSGEHLAPTITSLPKFGGAGVVEGEIFAGLLAKYNTNTEKYERASDIGYYNYTPRESGEAAKRGFGDLVYTAGVQLSESDEKEIAGVVPGGFTQLRDGRFAPIGRLVYLDGVVSEGTFVIDNGRDDFTRRMASMFGDSNPAFLGDYIENGIELMDIQNPDAQVTIFEDRGLIPGAEISIRRGEKIADKGWFAKIKFRDGHEDTFNGTSAFDLANQLTPIIKAGNTGTFSSDLDWNTMMSFNPKNDNAAFSHTILDYAQIEQPALDPVFYNEYKKFDDSLTFNVTATSLLRSLEQANKMGSSDKGGHVYGQAMDLSYSPRLEAYLETLTDGDFKSGFVNIKGTNLKVWLHRNHEKNGDHFDIRMQ